MIRKRIEEVDDDGRRTTTVVDDQGRRTTTVVEGPEVLASAEEAVETEPGRWQVVSGMLRSMAWWVGLAGLIVVAALALRLGFEMGDANPNSGFVDFSYDVTGPLVEPFEGIAEDRSVNGGGVFHPETAIAIGVYLLATALVMAAIHGLAGMASAADEGPVVRRTRVLRGH